MTPTKFVNVGTDIQVDRDARRCALSRVTRAACLVQHNLKQIVPICAPLDDNHLGDRYLHEWKFGGNGEKCDDTCKSARIIVSSKLNKRNVPGPALAFVDIRHCDSELPMLDVTWAHAASDIEAFNFLMDLFQKFTSSGSGCAALQIENGYVAEFPADAVYAVRDQIVSDLENVEQFAEEVAFNEDAASLISRSFELKLIFPNGGEAKIELRYAQYGLKCEEEREFQARLSFPLKDWTQETIGLVSERVHGLHECSFERWGEGNAELARGMKMLLKSLAESYPPILNVA